MPVHDGGESSEEAGLRGWVYIIVNESMQGLVKVGFTRKDPSLRASELTRDTNVTGMPTAFKVAWDALVWSPREVEQAAHKSLEKYSAGKEWFRCGADEAKRVITAEASSFGGVLASHEHFRTNRSVEAQCQSKADSPRSSYTQCNRCGAALGTPYLPCPRCGSSQ